MEDEQVPVPGPHAGAGGARNRMKSVKFTTSLETLCG
jgi:hypothetical protein